MASAGWSVAVGAPTRLGFATGSRRCASWQPVPSPTGGEDCFLEAVARAVIATGAEVVFASSDLELLALTRGRDRVPAVVPYPAYEHVRVALDKLALTAAAQRAGLHVPRTERLDAGGLQAVPGSEVVIKQRLHGDLEAGGRGQAAEPIIVAREEALAAGEPMRVAGRDPLVQELVSGDLMALTVLVDERQHVLARVQQHAERTWPSHAGCSARARTDPVEEDLAEGAIALLRELRWYGIAELQFLRRAERPPMLIDLNGRFYGSLGLARAAGVNLAARWGAMATGRPLPQPLDGRAGVRFQWLAADLRSARVERRGGLMRDAVGCVVWAFGAEHSIFSLRDPQPALRHYASMARGRLS